MKLIIDFPEKDYEFLKANLDNPHITYIQKVIAQGTPLPEGEWIDCSEDYGYAECPFCHELTTCDDNIDELHHCWNCGAELRKGGAE